MKNERMRPYTGRKPNGFWRWLAIVSLVLAVPQLCWSPARVGGVFFGVLAVCAGGEYFLLSRCGEYPVFGAVASVGRILFTVFVTSFLIVQLMILAGMHTDAQAEQADAVLVLGARVYETGVPSATLAARLDTALEFLEQHPDTVAVLCGGQGANEPRAEAAVMADYLAARGIAADRLILEDASSNTIQNIANAKKLLDTRLGSYHTAVISSDFHLARARRLMANAALDPYGIPAPTPYLTQRLALHLREYGSIMGLILTGRWF